MYRGLVRTQSRWLTRQIARDTGLSEAEVEMGFIELVLRGHVKVRPGIGPNGTDAVELIVKGRRNET